METSAHLPRATDQAAGTPAASRAPASARARSGLRAGRWADPGAVLGLIVGWRAATWLFALLAASSTAWPGLFPPASPADFIARVSLQGEALWHVWIAQGDYAVAAHGPEAAAFPPLFALLIRLVALVAPSWSLAGVIAAHVALAGALAYLVALVRLDADRDTGLRAAAAALLWPAAPFLGAVYPESTLLLAVAGGLYHARRGQWGRAGLWAALAGLTRGFGLLLVIPLLVEWLAQGGWRAARQRPLGLLALAAAPLGFGGFLLYLAWRVGSPLAYFRAQASLGPGSLAHPLGLGMLRDLPAVLTGGAPALRGYPLGALPFSGAYIPAAIDLAVLLVAAGAGLWLTLRVRRSYGLFVLAGVAVVALINGLPGAARHLVALAPLYVALAFWTRRAAVGYLAALLGLALVALTLFLTVNGFWAG